MRTGNNLKFLKSLTLSMTGLMSAVVYSQNTHPNIIYILADDLGYGDLSCYGQTHFSTPNIDKLAEEGMMFTSHYTGCPVSAPSRSVLMSGLHMGHTDIRGNHSIAVEPPKGTEGGIPMSSDIVTIAEVAKSAGYTTGAFGKWGLGYAGSSGDPLNQGFDEFFGYYCQVVAHRYYPAHLWHNREKVNLEGNDWTNRVVYAPDVIHDKALEFIRDNRNRTFFMYYPTILPHAELLVPDDDIYKEMCAKFPNETPYVGRGDKGDDYGPDIEIKNYCTQKRPHATFASMVTRLDKYVGELMQMVKDMGLEDNTIFIFASDNGPHREGGADPKFFNSSGGLKGIKRDVYEGGIRTPMIVKWKDKIVPGSHSDHISAFWDVKPTIAEILGVKIKEKCDGISFLPELLGKKQKKHDYLYWEFHEVGGSQAVRKGNWKAVRLNMSNNPDAHIELYDLVKDPHEEFDVSQKYPEVAAEMSVLMKQSHEVNKRFPFEYEVEK